MFINMLELPLMTLWFQLCSTPPRLPQPLSKGHAVPQEGSSLPCGLGSFPPRQCAPSPSFAPTLSNWYLFFLKNSRRTPQRVLHTVSPGLILGCYMALSPSPVYPAHLLTLCLRISSVSLSWMWGKKVYLPLCLWSLVKGQAHRGHSVNVNA